MRWFRKAEDNAPRLISLSPLRQAESATAGAADGTWTYQRVSDVPGEGAHQHRRSKSVLTELHLVGSEAVSPPGTPSNLPCTLKRKPAVRRRSGGKGKQGSP